MTLSTSAVAVCCCSDSRSSFSRRVFSMAITAWSANVVASSICLSVNGRTSWRKMAIAPISSPSLSIGTRRWVRAPALSTRATKRGSRST
jgi:hypothetical protein